MSPALIIMIAVAGAAGAAARFTLEIAIARLQTRGPMTGIVIVNLIGAALLGITAANLEPGTVSTVIAIGFLGAFTTFSTWMVQLLMQLEQRRRCGILLQLSPALLGPIAYLAGRLLAIG